MLDAIITYVICAIPRRTDIQISPHVRRNVCEIVVYAPLKWMAHSTLPLPLSPSLHSLFNSLAASIAKWCTYIREKELSKCIDGRGKRNCSAILEQRNTTRRNLYTKIEFTKKYDIPLLRSGSRLNKNKVHAEIIQFIFSLSLDRNFPFPNQSNLWIWFFLKKKKCIPKWRKKYFLLLVSFSRHYHPTWNTPLYTREEWYGRLWSKFSVLDDNEGRRG